MLNLTEEKLRSLGQQIQELQRTQSYMRQLVRDWRRKLSRTRSGDKAMLLLSLRRQAHAPDRVPEKVREKQFNEETRMKYGAIALLSLLSGVVVAQDTTQDDTMKNCPMHDQHQQQPHQSIVQSHGDQAMGFPPRQDYASLSHAIGGRLD